MLSYRVAVFSWLGGVGVMTVWMWQSGLPLWAASLTLLMAILIFIGLTRVVVEGGVAAAPVVVSADIRTFVMASCAHGLKLGEELGHRLRPLFWCMLLAIVVSLVGSVAMILHLAYEYGAINLNSWFFGMGTRAPFDYITTKLNTPTLPNISGWVNTFVGAGIMALLMLARQILDRYWCGGLCTPSAIRSVPCG